MKTWNPALGLVLSGGGARGAYQVGVCRAIAEIVPESGPFPIYSGTSAGAVNAVVLASHANHFAHGVERLEHFWGRLTCAQVYRTDSLTLMLSALRWLLSVGSGGLLPVAPPALLDNRPLRHLLETSIQWSALQERIAARDLQGVAVTASAYQRASAVSFFQATDAVQPWQRSRRIGQPVTLSPDHVLASAALPLLFPAEAVGHEYYGDGGMRLKAPLSPAIHLGAERILVIGTRDDRPDPAPLEPMAYPGPASIGGYLLDTVFMDSLEADLARARRTNQLLAAMTSRQREASGLRQLQTLVIKPSRDLRELTAAHAKRMPLAVRLLLRALGGWGRDWRMASYLLFEAPYLHDLMALGYEDGCRARARLEAFLQG